MDHMEIRRIREARTELAKEAANKIAKILEELSPKLDASVHTVEVQCIEHGVKRGEEDEPRKYSYQIGLSFSD